jgi:hypothetical protein
VCNQNFIPVTTPNFRGEKLRLKTSTALNKPSGKKEVVSKIYEIKESMLMPKHRGLALLDKN